jgi:putative transposase
LTGPISGGRIDAGIKHEILIFIEDGKVMGVSVSRVCEMLGLSRNRYYVWRRRMDQAVFCDGCDPLLDRPAGPMYGEAPHRLLREEKEKISSVLKEETYADLSLRQLSVVASEQGIVEASASSFYRQARGAGLHHQREVKTPVKQSKPEVNPTGPKQIWSWDITYIPFFGMFLYFIAILDVYSRKIVGWKLSFDMTVESVKQVWDQALCDEGFLGFGQSPESLEALSDHGTQMTAKSIAQFFRDLGISQLFARYQTPTDNAWIESFFRIFKYDWLRFQDVISFHQLEALIAAFVDYYNYHRYHGAIGYVTPHQKHIGQDSQILQARLNRKEQARQRRLEIHRQQSSQFFSEAA